MLKSRAWWQIQNGFLRDFPQSHEDKVNHTHYIHILYTGARSNSAIFLTTEVLCAELYFKEYIYYDRDGC